MMRSLSFLSVLFAASAAHAHPGHLVDAAGHSHWVAGAAIGAAIAVGIWGAMKGRRKGAAAPEPSSSADDRQEA